MKKLLFLVICSALCLSACKNTINVEEVKENVQNHYNQIETLELKFDAITSIYDKSQEFSLEFIYGADFDTVNVVKPEQIAGVSAKIKKDNTNLQIAFEQLQLETMLAENKGINPVDVTSFAINDLKNREPYSIAVSEQIKISYENEEILKDIYLNIQTYDIIKVEVYIENNMVISCNYS